MAKLHVRPGQSIVDAFEESKRARRMEIVSDAAIACAKAVEAARLDEREQCAKIADKLYNDHGDVIAHAIRTRVAPVI